MKHLTMLRQNGLDSIPRTLAELGPGGSLGIGVAGMLSGVSNYYALDVVRYTNVDVNLALLDDLVALFRARAGSPDKGWLDYNRYLDENLFPSHILTEEVLAGALSLERIEQIRSAIANMGSQAEAMVIKYVVPWSDPAVIRPDTVDVIVSQSVLEHVLDIETTYQALHSWLRPGGLMSHQIDFTSHGLSDRWNGYRCYSELRWKLMMGRRPYLINRQPCSAHINILKEIGFEIVCHLKNYRPGGIERSQLSPYWRSISDDDLTCSGMFVQARKT